MRKHHEYLHGIRKYTIDFMLYQFWKTGMELWGCGFLSNKCGGKNLVFLAATKQIYERFSLSVRTSVRPTVRPSHLFTMFPSSYQHELFRKHYLWIKWCHAKSQGQRWKVKVTEVKTQFSRFRTVTAVWIYIRQWNDAQSLMCQRRGALLFFKVIRQISRSNGRKSRPFWLELSVSGL